MMSPINTCGWVSGASSYGLSFPSFPRSAATTVITLVPQMLKLGIRLPLGTLRTGPSRVFRVQSVRQRRHVDNSV